MPDPFFPFGPPPGGEPPAPPPPSSPPPPASPPAAPPSAPPMSPPPSDYSSSQPSYQPIDPMSQPTGPSFSGGGSMGAPPSQGSGIGKIIIIGCGVIVALGILIVVGLGIVTYVFKDQIQQQVEQAGQEFQQNLEQAINDGGAEMDASMQQSIQAYMNLVSKKVKPADRDRFEQSLNTVMMSERKRLGLMQWGPAYAGVMTQLGEIIQDGSITGKDIKSWCDAADAAVQAAPAQ